MSRCRGSGETSLVCFSEPLPTRIVKVGAGSRVAGLWARPLQINAIDRDRERVGPAKHTAARSKGLVQTHNVSHRGLLEAPRIRPLAPCHVHGAACIKSLNCIESCAQKRAHGQHLPEREPAH